jgi:hypothetical protein
MRLESAAPPSSMPSAPPASFAELLPGETDRAALVGQTGSGKTTLAEVLCNQRPYVVAVDPKGMLGWDGYHIHTTLEALTQDRYPRLIYRPTYAELHDDEMMDLCFQWVYERQQTTLYIDEIYGIAQGDQYPYHFGACLTRGRERGVVVYCASQRPARVPQVMFSESEHCYIFHLKLPRDQERVEDMTGITREQIAGLPKWEFYYAPQEGEPVGPLMLELEGA